jgi:hypothetical protein
MHLRALSVDREIKNLLAGEGIAGSTLAVYSKAAYLKTDGGSIFVIGCPDIGNGPGFILLPGRRRLRRGVSRCLGLPACRRQGRIALDTPSASRLDPLASGWRTDRGRGHYSERLLDQPAFFPDERFEMGEGLVRLGGDRIVIEVGQASAWDPFFSPGEAHWSSGLGACMEKVWKMVQSRRVAPAVHEKVRALVDVLAGEREDEVRPAVRRLIGLGEGLTPSCDDLLVGLAGFMYGLSNDPSIGAYAKRIIASLGEELASAGGRTTPIAAHFLSEAGRGRFTERVKNMLEAIFAADEKRMERAREWLIEYGATSGVDLMWGMVLGYEVVNRRVFTTEARRSRRICRERAVCRG